MIKLSERWQQGICFWGIFSYIFFLFSRCTTAGISIFTGITAAILLFTYKSWYKSWYNIVNISVKDFFLCYALFFLSLFISAFLLGQLAVIHSTWRYFTWTISFFILYFYNSTWFYKKAWVYGIITAVFMIVFFGIHELIIDGDITLRISSYFAHPNHLATVLIVILPCLITSFFKCFKKESFGFKINIQILILGLSCILGIGLLIFSQSRGGISGFLIGGIFLWSILYIFKKKDAKIRKKISIFFLCIALFLGIIYAATQIFHRSYDLERILLIQSSYAMWKDHPIYGVGLERWEEEYPLYIYPQAREPNLPMPHNSIAYFFSTTGVIGGVGFLIFTCGTIGILVMKVKKYPYNIYYQASLWSFLALTLHGMVDTGITNKAAMQIMFAILGMAFASEKHVKGGKKNV